MWCSRIGSARAVTEEAEGGNFATGNEWGSAAGKYGKTVVGRGRAVVDNYTGVDGMVGWEVVHRNLMSSLHALVSSVDHRETRAVSEAVVDMRMTLLRRWRGTLLNGGQG